MTESATRKIIHIDMDAFFASVEQRDNPELRGKPVAVGGMSDRGVVAAASYEARKFGVRSAQPSVIARRDCPELIFVRPRFEVYKSVSAQIREVFAEYTPMIEPLSLDEAYLDVTANLRGLPSATDTARAIKAGILERTGLTASAGVSYNKLLAKLASDYKKPNGLYVITPDKGAGFVETLKVGSFHGIGPKTAEKMNRLGIFTGADMRNQPLDFLQKHFGKSGSYYYAIARGEDYRPVNPNRIRKSVGSETTFFENLTDFEPLKEKLIGQLDDVWGYCERTQIFGRTITLKVKFADFQIITRSRSEMDFFKTKDLFHGAGIALLGAIMPVPKPVRLIGASLHNLGRIEEIQASPQMAFAL